jgi:hypothetical protein
MPWSDRPVNALHCTLEAVAREASLRNTEDSDAGR